MLLAGGQALSRVWSKPPDLPVNTRDICRPADVEGADRAAPERERVGERSLPVEVMGQFFETLGNNLGAAVGLGAYTATTRSEDSKVQATKMHAASRMVQIGRTCEQQGDFAMARNGYEEATRLCPGSQYAVIAADRLAALDAPRRPPFPDLGGAEESST